MSEVKVKRSEFAAFLNTGTSAVPSWKRFGKGITSQAISYNPETVTETYIHEDSATTLVNAYAPTMDGTQTAYAGEPVFDFIDGLRQSRAIGDSAKSQVLLVYMYDYTESGTPSVKHYAAEKQDVTIQVESFGGEGGGNVELEYTVNFVGDATACTVTVSDGAPTIDA